MRRTGDKAIVMDMDSEEVFVLMNLDNYEGLLDDAHIAPPKQPLVGPSDEEDPTEDYALDDLLDAVEAAPKVVSEKATAFVGSSDEPKQEKPEVSEKKLDFDEDFDKKPTALAEGEESLADVPSEEEEEKFYLEPIE